LIADTARLDVYAANLACRNRTTRPLSGTENGQLAGVALVYRCRDYGVSLFATPWDRRT